jgi:hypothetical protein
MQWAADSQVADMHVLTRDERAIKSTAHFAFGPTAGEAKTAVMFVNYNQISDLF